MQIHRKLHLLAYSILRNTEEAEDVVSSVFTQAFENKEKINDITFENFMVISVKHKCVDILRSGRKRMIMLYPFIDESFSSVENPLENDSIADELNNAIDTLPPIQKKLIILKYIDGLDRKTITKICNSKENTIRNNLAFGLKNLRKILLNNS
jgi:RNA polymerase sigma-70 factor (ECF subfamily)